MSIWDKSRRSNKFSIMPEQPESSIPKRLSWQREAGKYSFGKNWRVSTLDKITNDFITSYFTPVPEPRLDTQQLTTSKEGKQFIKDYEKLRLHTYDDSQGYATIGYGHLIAKKF